MSAPRRESFRAAAPRPAPGSRVLRRQCACGAHTGGGACESCGKQRLQRSGSGPAPAMAPASVHGVLASPGRPLDASVRAFMEPRFGRDFSDVRLHTDASAAASARAVGASAYTVGRDLAFAEGHYQPHSPAGLRLLAHELGHVAQQAGAVAQQEGSVAGGDIAIGEPDSAAEREADRAADAALSGGAARPGRAPRQLARSLYVSAPDKDIPNPDGKGIKQTNGEAVEGYLRTLAPDGKVTVDPTSGRVSLDPAVCTTPKDEPGKPCPLGPLDKSSTPAGTGCLCYLTKHMEQATIVISDDVHPHTDPGSHITRVPSPNSKILWGSAEKSGKLSNLPPWLILGHEICGHTQLAFQGTGEGAVGEERHHNSVINENKLRKEHGLAERGYSLKDPYCGESFWRPKDDPAGPARWDIAEIRNEKLDAPTHTGPSSLDACREKRRRAFPKLPKDFKVEDPIP